MPAAIVDSQTVLAAVSSLSNSSDVEAGVGSSTSSNTGGLFSVSVAVGRTDKALGAAVAVGAVMADGVISSAGVGSTASGAAASGDTGESASDRDEATALDGAGAAIGSA